MTSRVDLVFWSLESWDEVWRRNQFFVDGLLDRFPRLRVLFVEPPVDPVHLATRGVKPRRGAGLRPVAGGPPERLWTFQPTKVLPRAVGGRAVDDSMARQVGRAAASLGMSRPLLWVNDPRAAAVMRRTHWPMVYDVTDDWVLAERSPRHTAVLVAAEQALLAKAEVVIVCSPMLQAAKGTSRPVHLVPNAVDLEALRSDQPRPSDLPAGPVALYLGTIHEDRIDVRLCVETAAALRGLGTLVLVGPVPLARDQLSELCGSESLVILGARAREQVPGYLQHADVLVVPHRVTPFTESLDPIKAYEYLAAGRPVVSTPVAGFRHLTEPGITVAAARDFPSAVRTTLSSVGGDEVPYHRDVPSWSDRVDTVVRILIEAGLLPHDV